MCGLVVNKITLGIISKIILRNDILPIWGLDSGYTVKYSPRELPQAVGYIWPYITCLVLLRIQCTGHNVQCTLQTDFPREFFLARPIFLFESKQNGPKTNKKKARMTQKSKTGVNCAFLRSKLQILRNLWNFLHNNTVAPFRNSDYRCRHTWYGRKYVLPRIMISYSYTLSSRIKWHIYRMNCPVIATFLGHGIRMKPQKILKWLLSAA